jgi:hypothetical protein
MDGYLRRVRTGRDIGDEPPPRPIEGVTPVGITEDEAEPRFPGKG